MDERLTAPWRPWEAAPLAVVAFLAGAVLTVLIVAVTGGTGGIALLLSTLALQAAMVACTIGWVRLRYPGTLPAMGLRSRRPAWDVFVGAIAGVALFLVVALGLYPAIYFIVEAITGRAPVPVDQLPFAFTPATVVLGVFVVLIAAPLSEEVFFRGFLFTSLRSRFGFLASAAISAAVFGAFHLLSGLVLGPLLFVVGFGLAYLYERRGSLVAPIAAHATFNLIGYALIVMERT